MGDLIRSMLASLIGLKTGPNSDDAVGAPVDRGRSEGVKLDLDSDDDDPVDRAVAARIAAVVIEERLGHLERRVRDAAARGACACRLCRRDADDGEVVTAFGVRGMLVKLQGFAVCRACLDEPDGRWRAENWAARDAGAWPDRADVKFADL